MNIAVALTFTLTLSVLSLVVAAQENQHMDMTQTSSPATLSESSREYMAAMGNMHKDMAAGVENSDPDVAFAKGMIPHHQGAIAMAETELKYGKDPEMRKMAEHVIAAQKQEIATMERWIKAHPAGAH